MRFQKFNVIRDRALDPLGCQTGVLLVFGLELRALTTFPVGALIKASIAAAMVARSW
jgi:hypothetical protein